MKGAVTRTRSIADKGGLIGDKTHHATTAGKLEYPPIATRYVPKYLAPMCAFDMFMPYPMAHKDRPTIMQGERIWMRSDHIEEKTTAIAEVRMLA